MAEIPYGMTVEVTAGLAARLTERRGGGRMDSALGGRRRSEAIRFTIIVPCHRVVGSGRAFAATAADSTSKAELLNSRAWIWRASICRTFGGPSGPASSKGLGG